MTRFHLPGLTAVTALIAVITPLVLAVYIAHVQGLQHTSMQALNYARDSLSRSNMTTRQVTDAIERLKFSGTKPCSPASLDMMREIDLASSYIQAIGYMSGDELVCASLDILDGGLDLGPADRVNARGVALRLKTTFPFTPNDSFLVIEKDGFAAIIHKNLPIDTSTEAGVALATYSTDSKQILTQRGDIDLNWLHRAGDAMEITFRDGDQVVAVTRSTPFLVGTVAAVPITYLHREFRNALAFILPLGLLCSAVFGFALRALINRQQSMPAVIRAALRKREFFLVYQPVVDLVSERWIGAEALLRWRLPNGELVRPDHFIPIAEDAGLITKITAQVVAMAKQDLVAVFANHPEFKLSINFSAADLQSWQSVALLRDMKMALNIPDGNLIVEATERSFMDRELTESILREIRAEGMLVAIDDFGTGYSNLAYLETFEFDCLKIDKAFVDSLNTGASTSQVVHHIITMAKTLNLRMVAEGVETREQADELRQQGVQSAQGWLFSKPLSVADLLAGLAVRG